MADDGEPRGTLRRLGRVLQAAPSPLSRVAATVLALLGAVLLLDFLLDTPVVTLAELLRCVLFGLACLGLPVSTRYPAAATALFLPGSAVAAVATDRIGIVTIMACVLVAVVATVASARAAAVVLAVLTAWAAGVSVAVYGDLTHLGPYLLFAVPATLVGLAFGRLRLHSSRTERHNRELLRRQAEVRARERESLARDLHDVVAHQLTLISLVGGSRARSSDPDKLRSALQETSELSREALVELRKLLRVLRDSSGVGTEADPTPHGLVDVGLHDGVHHLAQRLLDLGFPVDLTIDAPREIRTPRTTVESILRILQEATTNVVKYAVPASPVVIAVRLSPEALSLTVESEVAPARRRMSPELGTGQGIIGMQERAALLGGEAIIGPVGSTWSVQVALPL
ncbi:sensor histidine kinase [Georgenia sp. Marseille-Q6866]